MKKILAFGAFDPLHKGHLDFFRQAKDLGDHLSVVVTSDNAIRELKHYEPYQNETKRLERVQDLDLVDKAMIGSQSPNSYDLLGKLDFNIIAIGYDQLPTDQEIDKILNEKNKTGVKIHRLSAFHPEKFKGAKIRSKAVAKTS